MSTATPATPSGGRPSEARPRVPLARWIWHSYLKTTIWPLLLVELVIVLVYLVTGIVNHRENVAMLQRISTEYLAGIADREAEKISEKLAAVVGLTRVYAEHTGLALANPAAPAPEEAARYATSPDGVFYTTRDNGGAAVFYSGVAPIGPAERDKAMRLAAVDPLMRSLKNANPMVVQVYFNSFDSLNRIYPYMEVLGQYPAKMDIPQYNFYYEADAKHDPERRPVWTDAYLDPAGQGWIVSSIAPVYRGDFLEGVVGIDVTIATIIEQIRALDIPWNGYGVLVGKDGTLIALPREGEADWGLSELTKHDYQTAILKDTLKPDDFNLYKRPALADLARIMGSQARGAGSVGLRGSKVLAFASVPETGWKLLVLVPEANIYSVADELRRRALTVGSWMVGGMIAFYAVFFLLLFRRARGEAERLSAPLLALNGVVERIGHGEYHHPPLDIEIAELDSTGLEILAMGRRLGTHVEALRSTQAELESAKTKAELASTAKTQFIANMSHEIRTPMNGVLGIAELLLGTPLDEQQRKYVRLILNSGRSLLEIINEILDFSKIEAGKLALEEADFDVGALVRDVTDMLAETARARNLRLRLEPVELPDPWLRGDPARLRQVLVNLIGNAIKFTAEGGVTLRVRCLELDGEGATLEFQISDTGIGIPAEKCATIFEAFEQADATTTRRYGGTGLGLTISAQLVAAMGGHIEVDSTPGKGSTFRFDVRLRHAAPSAERELSRSSSSLRPSERPLRVLVAEDNPVNQLLVEAVLEQLGHEATIVGDGREALEALTAGRFDVALIDLQMPEMDGLEFAHELRCRERGTGQRLPVYALTAKAMPGDEAMCLSAGMDGYLTKPIDNAKLRATLDQVGAALPYDPRVVSTTPAL